MSVLRKHLSPNGKIPLWANMQIITSTGTKNAIIRPSLGFSTGTVRRFFLHVSGILSGISSRTVSSISFISVIP